MVALDHPFVGLVSSTGAAQVLGQLRCCRGSDPILFGTEMVDRRDANNAIPRTICPRCGPLRFVGRQTVVQAPVATVWEAVSDMEKFPDYMPDVTRVKVLERTEGRTVTKWEAEFNLTTYDWTEEENRDQANWQIIYKMLDSSILDQFEGVWQLVALDAHTTLLCLTVEYDTGLRENEEVFRDILMIQVHDNILSNLAGVKKAAESQYAAQCG